MLLKMPVSPEQRKILLERLEIARKTKAEKQSVPKADRTKKEPVVAEKSEAPQTVSIEPPVVAAQATAPMQKTQEPQHEEPTKSKKNPKNKYMKVVFYSEPGKKKVENLLKSLDDDDSEPAPVPVPKTKKPVAAKKKPVIAKPKEDDSLDHLARLYFN
jgi:hypothetical protein